MARTVGRSARTGLACLAVVLLMGAAATPPRAGAATSSPGSRKFSGPPLVIGVSISLSGDFADLAGPAKKGYELWAATVNAKGGLLRRKVSLKVVDDASNPTPVVTHYHNPLTADPV